MYINGLAIIFFARAIPSNGLIILESVSGNQYTWVSRDRVYLVTVEGRIQKTAGLPNNLTDLKSLKQTFEGLIKKPDTVFNYFAYYSYEQPNLTDLKVNVSLVNKGSQEVEILGEVRHLILFEEKISNDVIRWRETNLYWVDGNQLLKHSLKIMISLMIQAFWM